MQETTNCARHMAWVQTLIFTEVCFRSKIKEDLNTLHFLQHLSSSFSQRPSTFLQEKQGDVHWMLQCILSSVERGATKGPLFEFTPEFYMDAAINAFHGLRHYFHPTTNFNDIPGTIFFYSRPSLRRTPLQPPLSVRLIESH